MTPVLLLNALSLNMLAATPVNLHVENVGLDAAREELLSRGFESAVGHRDTAAVFSSDLGIEVPENRRTVALAPGSVAIVGQYRGPRLAEGATTLPEGATIEWLRVTVSAA